MYFLFKKIFVLTTSLALSIFGVNEFYAQASVLKDINKKVVNVSYLENYDNNNRVVNLDNNPSTENNTILIDSNSDIAINDINTSIASNINFTSTTDSILNDVSIHNKEVEEAKAKAAEQAKAAEEAANKAKEAQEKESQEVSSTYKATYTMEATAYTGDTTTATGVTPVRNPEGLSTIAVDPSIIPLGSKVYIPGYGEAIAADTGGAIKGHRIDLFLNSENECNNWGRQNVTLYVLAYPGEW
ncbi:3D domain-containing protein [Clostridioides difficile]